MSSSDEDLVVGYMHLKSRKNAGNNFGLIRILKKTKKKARTAKDTWEKLRRCFMKALIRRRNKKNGDGQQKCLHGTKTAKTLPPLELAKVKLQVSQTVLQTQIAVDEQAQYRQSSAFPASLNSTYSETSFSPRPISTNGYCEAETIAPSSSSISPLIENNDKKLNENIGLGNVIIKAREYVKRAKEEIGTPGMVIGVSLNGTPVWTEGFGFSNVENGLPCHAETVMRIASISKSMTMAVVAKLWEDGKLDIDKPVQHYAPSFPKKTFDGNEVSITTRLLASHLAGIRHYDKEPEDKNKEKNNKGGKNHKNKGKDESQSTSDSRFKEFFYKHKFKDVEESLKIFKDDDLVSKPGTSFLYTTHGWTLISAVVEGVTKEPFPLTMKKFFRVMGLKYTYLDENDPIIYNRAWYLSRRPVGGAQMAAPSCPRPSSLTAGGYEKAI
uniref:Beta-lactamase-related domain-containing protein n=1 Tax=Timema poppense TaxID=170557 RepID=A0A7R9CFF2_TIMPO|nr:unnamed protein product [Timema poppensis]